MQGFTVFNFTVLLHEVVHHTIFERRRPAAERALGWLYAVPSGISASQFTRWHLDHHAELGSDEDDPKRASPVAEAQRALVQALYARRRCSRSTSAPRGRKARPIRRICSGASPSSARCRSARTSSVLAAIWMLAGGAAALRAYIVPVFFIFPIAFTLNRLGQHYDIDPTDPAKWGTLMRGHWFWDFAFLNSNYHLEHHYFAGVPFYRLPALQRALAPFYARHRMRWQNYSGLLYGWLVENRAPHTNWSATVSEVRDAVVPGARVGPVDLARSDSRPGPVDVSALKVGAAATVTELDLGKLKGELRQIGLVARRQRALHPDRRRRSRVAEAPALHRAGRWRRASRAIDVPARVGDRLLDVQI